MNNEELQSKLKSMADATQRRMDENVMRMLTGFNKIRNGVHCRINPQTYKGKGRPKNSDYTTEPVIFSSHYVNFGPNSLFKKS